MADIDFWQWWILGAVLMGAEILLPGAFLLWVGFSALFTGLLAWVFPDISSFGAFIVFGVGSVGFAFLGNRYVKRNRKITDNPHLNDRGRQYIGRKVQVVQALENGRGKVQVGDTQWIALGEDAPVGAEVIVVDSRDTALVVERVDD